MTGGGGDEGRTKARTTTTGADPDRKRLLLIQCVRLLFFHFFSSPLEALCKVGDQHHIHTDTIGWKTRRTAVDDARARLVVLLLRAPQVLESAQRRKDRSTDPHRVLPLRRRHDLHLHARWRQRRQLLLHPVSNTGEHRRSTREHDVAVQVATDIEIALEDRVVAGDDGRSAPSLRMTAHVDHCTHVVSWIPAASSPRNAGWKSASGARNLRPDTSELRVPQFHRATHRSLPMVMT